MSKWENTLATSRWVYFSAQPGPQRTGAAPPPLQHLSGTNTLQSPGGTESSWVTLETSASTVPVPPHKLRSLSFAHKLIMALLGTPLPHTEVRPITSKGYRIVQGGCPPLM